MDNAMDMMDMDRFMNPRAIFVVAIALTLAACIPFSHYSRLTPHVSGKISDANLPVENVGIRVATGIDTDACGGKISESTTDSDGGFSLGAVREQQSFVVAMAYRLFRWNICIEEAGEWRKLGSRADYARVDSGPASGYVVNCDLARETARICKFHERYNTREVDAW